MFHANVHVLSLLIHRTITYYLDKSYPLSRRGAQTKAQGPAGHLAGGFGAFEVGNFPSSTGPISHSCELVAGILRIVTKFSFTLQCF